MVAFYSSLSNSFGLLTVCLCLLSQFEEHSVEGRVAVFGEDTRMSRSQALSRMTERHKNAPLYEGDIVLTEEQKKEMANERVRREITNQRVRRKITTDLSKRWKLPVNYTFDGTHDYSERQLIRSAVFHWSSQTCIRLREISFTAVVNETIVFTRGSGCWSSVGFDSDKRNQKISIGPGCLWMGTIAHEVGHMLGFWHEQARPDRDDYVTVLTNNVMIDHDLNFEKSTWGEVMSYGVPYDVGSLMHYGSKFFSENGKRTIQTNDPRLQKVIGQRDGLSFADVKLANLAYCSEMCQNQIENDVLRCKNDGYPDPLNCSTCRCPNGLGGRTCETVAKSSQGCGGVLRAAHREAFVQSPGYPNGYSANVQCHWLIQAPPGYRIFFEFVDVFSLTEDEDADACVDFLEVRYYDNLSFTGGRFCGSRRPADTMISQNSQLLLLFRSAEDGKIGFRARYHTEACGGCLSSAAPREKACVRTVTYPCLREWRIRTRAPCITWWSWTITDCGYTYKTMTREDTCSRTERYCCKNFRLDGDVCQSTTYEENKFPSYKGGEPGKLANETRVIPVGWSTWSGWSECTKPCGGCGRRVRTRTCSDPVFCGGLEQQEQSEGCNNTVCPPSMMEFCPLRYAVKAVCNPWTQETCIQYKTKLTTCHLACCKGYVQSGQRCIKSR